jgi:hypothetical protein
MLSKISWSEFIWFIIFLVIPYYLFVISVYFRKEMFAFFKQKHNSHSHVFQAASSEYKSEPSELEQKASESKQESFNDSENNSAMPEQDDVPFTVIHELIEDLKKLFAVAAKTKMIKEELMQAVRSKLKTYPILRGADIQEDINQHIRLEAQEVCKISLSPEDIKLLWQP